MDGSRSSIARHASEILAQGYTIVRDVLSPDEVATARDLLTSIFERESSIGHQRGWHTKQHKVSYMLVQKHEFFRNLPLNPRVLPLMRKVLGENCILSSFNGLTMSPGGEAQALHLDQHDHVPGLVININALHTLDDFTKANGCTRVVPGSHNRAPGTKIDREREERDAIYLEAPAGSLIAFNGGLIHAGSANRTERMRRCVHAYFTRPWCRPQWDLPRSLSPDVIATLSEDQKKLFGFGGGTQWYDYETDETRHD
jgi:ectoine hydroxylase-related dioxygenase (phytanoyl-CoA dioxygenase family)